MGNLKIFYINNFDALVFQFFSDGVHGDKKAKVSECKIKFLILSVLPRTIGDFGMRIFLFLNAFSITSRVPEPIFRITIGKLKISAKD